MFPSQFSRVAALAVSLSALSTTACSSSKEHDTSSLTAGITLEPGTTAAALDEFVGAAPDEWGWAGGNFTAPTDQAVLPAATPATFTWRADDSGDSTGAALDPSKTQGQVFLVQFGTATQPKLLRLFTPATTYTPDAATWQELVSAANVTLTLTEATFENDQIEVDGGPHTGQTIHVTIQ